MQLYTFDISPNGKRVRIGAAEMNVPLELKNVDFQKGEQRRPEYLAINPVAKAPTLTDDGFAVWESAAILIYLATKSGSALYPMDPSARGDLMRWMFFCACHVDPYFTILVPERFLKARRGLPPDEALCAYAELQLARFVPIVEQQLAKTDYIAGQFGLADITLGCTLELSPAVKYDLAPYPKVRAWLDRLHARPHWH
jgi:glutathione S-transferase